MSHQEQFLDVIDRDEAERRFHAALALVPLGEEIVPLDLALGRVLAANVTAAVDVPSFDRANVDGFAVCASDTFGASEERPQQVGLLKGTIATGVIPGTAIRTGTAIGIATGGMVPRGADAVVMIEHTDVQSNRLFIRRAVSSGANISFAGTDICACETVLHRGRLLTSRETGVLAAIGSVAVAVHRRPRVAVISTGDEIVAPGAPMQPGLVYDSNARILADAVREAGGEPVPLGIVRDDLDRLRERLYAAFAECDVVLLSGGTSKGAGDLSYRVVSELRDPGIVAHGVALKPGKPICLAVSAGKPVVILPGFPTSAIFTFHEFVAPVIRSLAGIASARPNTVPARLAVKVNSEIGRTEYLLVGLIELMAGDRVTTGTTSKSELIAYPMGKGSGSVTTFSSADGFITIGRHEEIVPAGAAVEVQLLGRELQLADLVVIGSHCVGLDSLLNHVRERGWRTKSMWVGSTGGLEAAKRGECDIAGVHLLDPATGEYNRPFMTSDLELITGYARMQGIVFRKDDEHFNGSMASQAIERIKHDAALVMVNRNQGSGTRILIDRFLEGATPAGYAVQPRSHNAVAAAVAQQRADWGVCIETVARTAGLGFLPLAEERYDFILPKSRRERPAVQAFCTLLAEPAIREQLSALGFR